MKLGEFNCSITEDGPSYTHPASDRSERTILEIVASDDNLVFLTTINLDVSALTMGATFRVSYKIDGTNYRRRYGTGPAGGIISWTPADGPWISFLVNGIWDHDIKITIESTIGEASPRDIPYSYNGAR